MKAITKLFLVLFAVITCLGCEKIENDNNEGQNNQEDFYYVRFDANAQYGLGSVRISLTGCEGYSFTSNGTTFSEILGPALKGAMAKISVGSGNSITSIHVSKNNGPFALKKQGYSSLSYTIDF